MGNYISYTPRELAISAAMVAVYLFIRPYLVRLSDQAQERARGHLEAEAAENDAANASSTGRSNSGNAKARKRLD